MTDKERFPSLTDELNAWREDTTFWDDFTIAEAFGFRAVKDTWKRAFGGWKNSAKYLLEICVVVNQKAWYWAGHDDKLSAWYSDRYYECRDWAFRDDTNLTEEEQRKFYDVID